MLLRLGRFLREKREECGWSQEDLAHECGLHRTYIGAVERGEYNITVLTLRTITETLGVSMADAMAASQPGRRRG